jgi:hypothetical protein
VIARAASSNGGENLIELIQDLFERVRRGIIARRPGRHQTPTAIVRQDQPSDEDHGSDATDPFAPAASHHDAPPW